MRTKSRGALIVDAVITASLQPMPRVTESDDDDDDDDICSLQTVPDLVTVQHQARKTTAQTMEEKNYRPDKRREKLLS